MVVDIQRYQNGSRDINRHVDNEDKVVSKMELPSEFELLRYFRIT